MRTSPDHNILGYVVLAAGLALAFVSAVVPFYTAGYQLRLGVLIAGVTPYLAYGLMVVLLHRPVTNVVGVILLAAHLWLVAGERFIKGGSYADPTIHVVPLVLAVLLLPWVVQALRQPWRG